MASSKQKTTSSETSTQQTSPWAPQAGALTGAMGEATNIYNANKNDAPSDFIAGFNPDQLATFRRMLGYGANTAPSDAQAAAGNTMLNAGVSGTTGALSGFQNFDPNAANNAGSLIADANKYVAGQDIDAQVNNAMLNARQTARDVTMPGISQNAARTGNTNSSRTGIAEGMVQRGLAQQATDLGASLRSDAFKDGLSLASNNAQANNASRLAALSGQAGTGTSAAEIGRGALSGSIDDMGKLFEISGVGGSGLRDADQAALDNKNAMNDQEWQNLRNYMQIIGSQVYGQNSTGTKNGTSETTSTPSGLQIAGGLLGAAGSLFGGPIGGALGGGFGSLMNGFGALKGGFGLGSLGK